MSELSQMHIRKPLSHLDMMAPKRPEGYKADVLSYAIEVNEIEDWYSISSENWVKLREKYSERPNTTLSSVPRTAPMKMANTWKDRGPKLWKELHGRAKVFAGDVGAEQAWLSKFDNRIGCGECKKHWLSLKSNNPADLRSAESYFRWTWMMHNMVSRDINIRNTGTGEELKALISLEEAIDRWGFTRMEKNGPLDGENC